LAYERDAAMAVPRVSHLEGPKGGWMAGKWEVARVVNLAEQRAFQLVFGRVVTWADLWAVRWAVTWVALRVALSEGPMVALWVGQ